MSCFVCGEKTLNAVVQAARYSRLTDLQLRVGIEHEIAEITNLTDWAKSHGIRYGNDLLQFLYNMNIAAYDHRYGIDKAEILSYPAIKFSPYEHFTLGEIYGSLQCFEYQVMDAYSIEDWRNSGLRVWIDNLKEAVATSAFKQFGMAVPYGINGYDMTKYAA